MFIYVFSLITPYSCHLIKLSKDPRQKRSSAVLNIKCISKSGYVDELILRNSHRMVIYLENEGIDYKMDYKLPSWAR